MTDFKKSIVFLVFASAIKEMLNKATPNVPIDILTKDQLVNFRVFVEKNFPTRKTDTFVTRDLLQKKFSADYPDFDMTSREIINGMKKLPADWNISYEKSKRFGGGRGIFLGLYSPDEAENVIDDASRDMELEKTIMDGVDSDSDNVKRSVPILTAAMDVDRDDELSGYSSAEEPVAKPLANKNFIRKEKVDKVKIKKESLSSDSSSSDSDINKIKQF